MNKGYANSLGEICGNPIQSVDKMHLFIEANRVVDQVRDISRYTLQMNFIKVEDMAKLGKKCNEKITVEDLKKLNNSQNNTKIEAMKKYKEKADQRLNIAQINKNDFYNSKGEKIDYCEITPEYFIEKGYRKLFFYREKNLSGQQRLRLNQIFKEFDYLGFLQESWTLKEDFMDALDELNITEIDRIRDDCLKSEHYRIKQFGRTIKRWYAGIKGFCEHSTDEFKFTNALTEGINNLCKVAKRVSHGFSSKVMYIKKLTARFCLKKLEI
ncbi:MAG: transposase [Candidatus Gracilibacteria bacterium]|nr:transposase [Candidatus Gracilibacteria bacterium]